MIELKWIPHDTNGSWDYGELVFLCNKKRIGDSDNLSNLPTILGFMNQVLKNLDNYDDKVYINMEAKVIFAELYDPYMIHKIADKYAMERPNKPFPRNVISYVGDASMYDWAVILLNFSDSQRLLWANLQDDIIHECLLPPLSVQKAFEEFILNYSG